ncbi:hypothetical protein L4D21_20040 [Photobacterium profundum]|uniref:hypothetical protein n=1 Tax=Photobacterium profundum TaxID=74109 RepID=UPI003D0A7F40
MKKSIITALIIAMITSFPVSAKRFGEWNVKSGSSSEGKYRFAEQITECTQGFKQRVDFTFSNSAGWEFTFTTRYIADKVSLIVDGNRFDFDGQSGFHKMSWPASSELITLVKNTKNPLLISEGYNKGSLTGNTYCVVEQSGSAAALIWASDI